MSIVFAGGSILQGAEVVAGDIRVTGGRIEAVTSPGQATAGRDDDIYDASDLYIMPGMHMCHFHGDFGYMSYDLDEVIGAKYPPGVQTLIGERAARTLLASGFTSIAGAGCSNDIDAALVLASKMGITALPRVLPSGPMIGTTGQPEVDVVNWWEGRSNLGTYVVADGADQFRRQARDHIRRGARIIKILYSAGRPMGPTRNEGERYMSLDELRAVVEAAHERGCKVRAHVAYRDRIQECVEAGVDLIDHGDEVDEEILNLMAERGTFWVPSMLFLQYLVDSHRRSGTSTEEDLHREARLARMREMASYANRAGVRILLGDDYGFAFLDHRPGIYAKEITMWVQQYGFAAADVLRWATVNGAALHGLDPNVGGRLVDGADADLLVLRVNPLVDPSALEQPDRSLAAILVRGEFDKNALSRAGVQNAV